MVSIKEAVSPNLDISILALRLITLSPTALGANVLQIRNVCYDDACSGDDVTVTTRVLSSTDVRFENPCAGANAIVTAHVTDDFGVTSVILNGNPMILLTGDSKDDTWTYTVSGPGKNPGDTFDITVTVRDASGSQVSSDPHKITWRDCASPALRKGETQ